MQFHGNKKGLIEILEKIAQKAAQRIDGKQLTRNEAVDKLVSVEHLLHLVIASIDKGSLG